MNYSIPEEIKNQILELKKTMERIKLDGLNFEYNQNPYGDIEIHIMEFNEHWEVRVVNECKKGGLWYRILDTYKIIGDELIYQDTEKDIL